MTEKGDIRYSWKDWNWGEWTENVEHMPRALREHIRGVIDQCEGERQVSNQYVNICNIAGLPDRETYGYKYIEACAAIWGIDPALIRRITVEADNSGYHQDVLQVTVVLTGTKDLLPKTED